MTKYLTTIGLEFHAELKTRTKIFCSCPTEALSEPNTHVCPVCLGLPGVLPVLNRRVVELAVKAGLALNCDISRFSKFDRKNYFYPDLPKGYQVTQFPMPICRNGFVTITDAQGQPKNIHINRIHMEEDAGKLVHSGDNLSGSTYSMPDYNRAAVPLVEIVTEPDLSSAEEARDFGETLRLRLLYAGVSDVRMERGSLRCDVNISLRPEDQEELGVKVELKNLNSFRAVYRAIKFEEERQSLLLDKGLPIVQETRLWDEASGETRSMRSKEDAHDYRYFPEPDLVPVVIDDEWLSAIRGEMPELPEDRPPRSCPSPIWPASLTAPRIRAASPRPCATGCWAISPACSTKAAPRSKRCRWTWTSSSTCWVRWRARPSTSTAPAPCWKSCSARIKKRRISSRSGALPRSLTLPPCRPPWVRSSPPTPSRWLITEAAKKPPSASWWAR